VPSQYWLSPLSRSGNPGVNGVSHRGANWKHPGQNLWRKQEGIPPVKIGGEEAGLGTRYFEDPIAVRENTDISQFETDISQFETDIS
jgi:hypothetical protein